MGNTETRGFRNNNPTNIKHSRDIFKGEVNTKADPIFKRFVNMKYGIRAAFCILTTYFSNGYDTPALIAGRWIEEKGIILENYTNKIAAAFGSKPNYKIEVCKENFIEIVAGMVFQENNGKLPEGFFTPNHENSIYNAFDFFIETSNSSLWHTTNK